MLEALIELVKEQNPARIQIGERCAMGADTMKAMEVCGIVEVAKRTGVELCPFEHVPFDMYKIDRPISFNEFPVPRPVREADVYIGLPKMKVHVHTTFTGAMKLQFGNLPDYDWMVSCHRDDIYQKIVNLTRAANPKWFVMDSLYACQGNGPFSPYSDDLIKDFNTICGGPDPVAVDTICEALMDWDYPGTNVPSTVLGAAEGLGTNRMDEIELTGAPIDQVKRRFRRQNTILQGQYPNVNVVMGSTCEAGCKAIVRIQLDQLQADGTLDKLKRPLYVFTGLQFEQQIQPVDGDVIVVGDCAKRVLERFPECALLGRVPRSTRTARRSGRTGPDVGHRELRPAPAGGAGDRRFRKYSYCAKSRLAFLLSISFPASTGTAFRSSMVLKGPFFVRYSTTAAATSVVTSSAFAMSGAFALFTFTRGPYVFAR